MKGKTKSFTLLELIIVVVILGILAAIAIPNYTNTVEQRKGEACIINMRIILGAWSIYNLNNDPDYPEGFYNINQINGNLRITIDERNFGHAGESSNYGFYMFYDLPSGNMRIFSYRQSGLYKDTHIQCIYDPSSNSFSWDGSWFIDYAPGPPSFPLPT